MALGIISGSLHFQVKYEEASQVANDAVGGIRTVASFCSEKKVMDLYGEKCKAPQENGIRLGLVSGTGFGFSFLVLYCVNAFLFYIGAILVRHGKATFGEVFKVNLCGADSSSSCSFDKNLLCCVAHGSESFAGVLCFNNFCGRSFSKQCIGTRHQQSQRFRGFYI